MKDESDARRTWIELDADLRSPAAMDPPEREDGGWTASPASVRRRDFLKLAALSAGIAACERLPVKHAMPYLVPPEGVTPGVPLHYASTCTACPASCGLVATVRDGRPVKLEGRPEHPVSRGGLCALGQADLRALYDAGRLAGPRLRGQAATWAELDAFVAERLAQVKAAGGSVYVLAPSLVSPTARQVVRDFLLPCGGTLVEHDFDPECPSALLEAHEVLAGRPLAPALDLERADLLVVLAADLLGTGPDPVAHAAAYAARRRAAEEGRAFRHVQIEGSLSLTGAAADERWPATADERRLAALWILSRVAAQTPGAEAVREALAGLPPVAHDLDRRLAQLAEALGRAQGRSLVVSGANDLAEQLAVAILNRLLGNEGASVDVGRPSLVRRGLDRDLAGLVEALAAGRVGALFVVGCDPLDAWPDADVWKAALAALPLSVAVTDRPTATAAACQVVAAAHHGLESWGDAEPRPGVLTLAQPLVTPLFETRHPFEGFLHWSAAPVTDFRLVLKDAWRTRLGGGADFETVWTDCVSRGMPPAGMAAGTPSGDLGARGSAGPAPAAALREAVRGLAPAASAGLEAELIAEVGVRDGRRAHVSWLRELPDPLTRVAWTACVRVAPETARGLGVRDGDVVRVEVGDRSVAMPARVLAGQHPRVLALPVGYGFAHAGEDGARNAVRIARTEAGRLRLRGLPASLRATGAIETLPLVQTQPTAAGRDVVRQLASYDEHAGGHARDPRRDLWPERAHVSPQWHMVVDLDACTGCSACVVACVAENNIAVVGPDEVRRHRDMHWLRVDRYFSGDPQAPDVLFEPMLCAQCGHAPCETVCPVAATVHSEDGLNQQVYNRCVGTRYCANNCPYKARRFNWFENTPSFGGPVDRMVLNPDVVVRGRGVMEKCTFCVQRIQLARLQARDEGRDVGDVQTACQQSCPARAIHFGDRLPPDGEIARLRAKPRAFQVLAELGVEPAVTYLARVRSRDGAGVKPGGGHA